MKKSIEFIQENKFASILFVVLFVAVLIIASKKIKNIKNNKGRFANNDKSKLTKSKDFYQSSARRLKNALDGVSFDSTATSERGLAIAEILKMNDDEIKEVYNRFNKIISPSEETMLNWLNDEYMPLTDLDDKLVQKLIDLGLG